MKIEPADHEEAAEKEAPRDNAKARKALLAAVEGNDSADALDSPRRFLDLFVNSNTTTSILPGVAIRVQRKILYETIAAFNKATATRFFAGLNVIVLALLESDIEANPDVPDALQYAATTVKAYVTGMRAAMADKNRKLGLISEALAVGRALHDAIFDLDFCPEAQGTIVSMCEALYLANVPEREHLIMQALPLLVASAAAVATEDAFAKDVKRLYTLREALQEVDFADESSDYVRKLLLSLASSPLCLKQPDGIKLLAYMLRVDKLLRNDLHLAIRAQIPQQKKNFVKVYGNIYLAAWKEVPEEDEDTQQDLEDLIGQFAVAMLHAKNPNLNKNLLVFMEPFHEQQKTPAIEDMLYRVYGPILWRSLSARNSLVREYATNVLGRVFPLQDSSHCRAEQAFQQACKALTERLNDEYANVRMAAAEAVGMILTEFWTALPSPTTHSLLNRKLN